jgi:hypothetical protein
MNGWTIAWAGWFLYLLVVEVLAYVHGGYWATLTGTTMRAMLTHPMLALFVIGGLATLIAHLAFDYTYLRLKP